MKLLENKKLLLAILLVIIVLGGFSYQSKFKNSATKTASPPPVMADKSYTPSSVKPHILTEDFTQEEVKLLTPPKPGAPKEEVDAHDKIINQFAVKGDKMELNKCVKPEPLVLEFKLGSEITLTNNDSKPHTLIIDPEHRYTVEANGSKVIKTDFPKGAGGYGYLCDDEAGVAGFFLVTL